MKRVFAWVVFALVLFGVAKAVQAFKNPWAVPSIAGSSVLPHLPPAAKGCGGDCFD